MATPIIHIERLRSSVLAKASPKKRKAIKVANKGEVLFKNANLESDISLIAILNMKNVNVPVMALIMISFH